MKRIAKKPLLIVFFCLSALQARAANIIFDLGDVLIETKYAQSVWSIGPVKMAYYASTLHNPFKCNTKLYEFLDEIKPHNPNQVPVKDHNGYVLPQLMCDWLSGAISYTNLLEIIDKNSGHFANWAEEKLVRSLAETIFIPEKFVATRTLISEGISFVLECKAAGHKVYVLSNWDPASFILLQEMCPDVFQIFDGIMISGDVGLLKPDPRIFTTFLSKFQLKAQDCIFIDDQVDNVVAAQSIGMYGILYCKKPGLVFTYPNFDRIRDRILDWETSSKNFSIPINRQWYNYQNN